MAGNKYIKQSSGSLVEEAAIQSSAGAGDAGKIPALDAAGRLDNSMMPAGIGADTAAITASENLAAGGSLALNGADLVLTAPTIAGGDPVPTIVLTSLTRDLVDVLSEVVGGVIVNATAGEYVALWTASNGVEPNATATDTLTA